MSGLEREYDVVTMRWNEGPRAVGYHYQCERLDGETVIRMLLGKYRDNPQAVKVFPVAKERK